MSDRAADASAAARGGVVHLVGVGPGDPDLLTVRALNLVRSADVVVYDRLVSPAIMALVPSGVARVSVGKCAGDHPVPQSEINEVLARLARSGRRVVRLKGGDPYTFGRGGEEGEHLADAGIAFDVTPGVTAASGCAASAGIPLTHRRHAHACLLITGHLQGDSLDLDWPALTARRQTLVFYMAIATAPRIARGLMEHGLGGATPVAIVENGTTPRERVITGELRALDSLVERHQVTSPALLIVGEVVRLRERLAPMIREARTAAAAEGVA